MNKSSNPLKVFISYSHNDEVALHELEKHLTTLKRENLIDTWHDRKISPGQEWEGQIGSALNESDIFLFLISPDFIASEYCIEKEVRTALDMHDKGDALVIPIIIRPVDWLSTPISKIQALPKDAKPISTWTNPDQAWYEVTKGIRNTITNFIKKQKPVTTDRLFVDITNALREEVERLDDIYRGDRPISGLSTSLLDFDEMIDGIHLGDVILIASAPMMDKMALLTTIAKHTLLDDLNHGLIFTLRQTREKFVRQLCAAVGCLPINRLTRAKLFDDDWQRLTFALGTINEKNIAIADVQEIEIETLLSQIELYKKQYSVTPLVFIDSLELISGGNKSRVISKIRQYARTNKCTFIILSGLEGDPSIRPNKRPVLKDLGNWILTSEDVDIVVFLYQDEFYNFDSPDVGTAEIIIDRNPRGQIGTVRTTYLRDLQVFANFFDPDKHQN